MGVGNGYNTKWTIYLNSYCIRRSISDRHNVNAHAGLREQNDQADVFHLQIAVYCNNSYQSNNYVLRPCIKKLIKQN